MKYTHLIVSKINVKSHPQANDEIWVKNRINLLNNILRPSLEAQSNKKFKFISLWGGEVIGGYKLDNEHQLIINSEGGKKIYNEALLKLVDFIDDDYVLTTRVDSDNALSVDFIENLHNHIIETEVPFYYDIKKMNMLELKTRKKTLWDAKATSGFVSVMEESAKYKCIPYKSGHGTVGKICDGLKFDDLIALCSIHGENLHMVRGLGLAANFDEKNKYGVKL